MTGDSTFLYSLLLLLQVSLSLSSFFSVEHAELARRGVFVGSAPLHRIFIIYRFEHGNRRGRRRKRDDRSRVSHPISGLSSVSEFRPRTVQTIGKKSNRHTRLAKVSKQYERLKEEYLTLYVNYIYFAQSYQYRPLKGGDRDVTRSLSTTDLSLPFKFN